MRQVRGQPRVVENGKLVGHSSAKHIWAPLLTGLLDHDEDSDGFLFTRTRSKKAKAAAVPKEPEPILEVAEEQSKPTAVKRSRKKAIGSKSTAPDEREPTPEKRRRSPRHSGESIQAEPPPVQVKKRRVKEKDPSTPAPEAEAEPEPSETAPDGSGVQHEEATKIALPFADTPIQRRNKEMRANSGQRRSSLGNRGRRASSLIDSGKSNGSIYGEISWS